VFLATVNDVSCRLTMLSPLLFRLVAQLARLLYCLLSFRLIVVSRRVVIMYSRIAANLRILINQY